MTLRERLLLAIAARGTVRDPGTLLDPGDRQHDLHSVVHALFMLRRAGLVTFKERRPTVARAETRVKGSRGVNDGRAPADIRLTRRGEETAARIGGSQDQPDGV